MSLGSFPKRGFASLPDNVKLAMPALSPTMEQGNIVKWNYKVGDKVDVGDQICEVETDKATLGFEVQDPGYIAAILVGDGAKGVKVGTPIVILVDEEAHVKAFENYKEEGSSEGAKEEQPKEQTKEQPKEEKEQGKQQKQEGSVAEEKSKSNKKSVGKKTAAKKPPTQKDLPHHSKVAMPALSPTMETGKITQWQKKEGDKIDAGETIANVETDKATIDFVYQDDGYLAKIISQEGQGAIKVGEIVAIVVDDQADVAAFKDYSGESEGQEQQPEEDQSEETEEHEEESHEQDKKPQEGKKQESAPTQQRASGERVIASPYAQKTAKDQSIDLSQVEGSGPNGRILKHNVDEFVQKGGAKAKETEQPKETKQPSKEAKEPAPEAKAQPPKPKAQEGPKVSEGQNPYTDIPLTNVREIIAKRLLQSKTTVPHYYLETEIVMDEIIKIRNQLNENNKTKISFNDIFIKAAAMACVEVPEVNSQWQGQSIRRFKNADVSVAVDTGSGLITPIVFSANAKGLNEISLNAKELIEKAKKNTLKPQEFQGGTFSISNLGMFGISNFAAVINPPQSAILAVGKTDKKVVAAGDGNFKTVSVMNVTLSCDHRVVDGAVGARWLEKFKTCLEKPLTMLL